MSDGTGEKGRGSGSHLSLVYLLSEEVCPTETTPIMFLFNVSVLEHYLNFFSVGYHRNTGTQSIVNILLIQSSLYCQNNNLQCK